MAGVKRILRVFLCHASGDKAAVYKLYERLTQDGIDAWLDQEKLLPGQNWQIEIPKAVRNSDVVIVCLSGNSVNKEGYVQKEIKFALDFADEKPDGTIFIIPARLESCNVPDRLSQYHWVDLFADSGYEKLLKALQIRAGDVGATIGRRKPASREGVGTISAQPVSKKKPEPEIKSPERDVKPIESEPAKEISAQAKLEPIAQPKLLRKSVPVVEQPKREIKPDAPAPVNKQVSPDLKPEQDAKKPKPGYKVILGSLVGLLVAGFIFFMLLNFISKLGGNPVATQAPTGPPTKAPVVPTATKANTLGTVKKSPKDGMSMVYIPASGNVAAFWIDQTAVTREMFQTFVSQTSYKTEPETSGVAALFFAQKIVNPLDPRSGLYSEYNWKTISGINWMNPAQFTPYFNGSSIPFADWDYCNELQRGINCSNFDLKSWDDVKTYCKWAAKDCEMIIQITWNDAKAYCEWAGRELVSSEEWELAHSKTTSTVFYDKYEGLGEWGSNETKSNYRAVLGYKNTLYNFAPFTDKGYAANRSANILTFRCKTNNP